MYCTREGVISVQDINLLPAVSVDVARRHPNGVALAVPQGVEGRAAVVDGDVDQPLLLLVVLEHKVRPIVAAKAPVESCYLLSERHCQQNERQLLRNVGLRILHTKVVWFAGELGRVFIVMYCQC